MEKIRIKSDECKKCICPNCIYLENCISRKEHVYDVFVECDEFEALSGTTENNF